MNDLLCGHPGGTGRARDGAGENGTTDRHAGALVPVMRPVSSAPQRVTASPYHRWDGHRVPSVGGGVRGPGGGSGRPGGCGGGGLGSARGAGRAADERRTDGVGRGLGRLLRHPGRGASGCLRSPMADGGPGPAGGRPVAGGRCGGRFVHRRGRRRPRPADRVAVGDRRGHRHRPGRGGVRPGQRRRRPAGRSRWTAADDPAGGGRRADRGRPLRTHRRAARSFPATWWPSSPVWPSTVATGA